MLDIRPPLAAAIDLSSFTLGSFLNVSLKVFLLVRGSAYFSHVAKLLNFSLYYDTLPEKYVHFSSRFKISATRIFGM